MVVLRNAGHYSAEKEFVQRIIFVTLHVAKHSEGVCEWSEENEEEHFDD